MNHRRQLAAALACTLALGLCGGHVLADGTADPSEIVPAPEIIAPAPDTSESQTTQSGDAQTPPNPEEPSAGETLNGDAAALESNRESIIVDEQISQDATFDDADGTVSFRNLEARLRENNLNLLSLEQSLESIDAVDLEEMEDNLNAAIQMLRSQQAQLKQLMDGTSSAVAGLEAALKNTGISVSYFEPALIAYPKATIASLEMQIASYEATLEQLEDGVIAAEYDAASSQLMNAQDQIVMGAETLYITLLGLEQTAQSLDRNLAALDRTLAELDIRYEMGQISALTLAEAKAGRTSLVSGITTLDMNRTALKRQLEAMLGEEITGTIRLQPLSAVTQEQISAMDYESDLKSVKRHSYELEAANKAWSDAEDEYQRLRNSSTAADYEADSARYAARAANLSRQATMQSIELKFSTAYDTVKDQQQVLAAAKTTLAVRQDSYAAAQLKYEQGAISKNELLDARDAMDEAQDTVDTAAVDLFTAYNNYRWAVNSGILN